MTALGNRPAARISTRDVEELLATVSATGVFAAHREQAPCGDLARPSTTAAVPRPTDWQRTPPPRPTSAGSRSRAHLVYYSPEEVEALARALGEGRHREPSRQTLGEQERKARRAEDQQDAELVRVAAYAGLRLGELLALRWRDVDFAGHALTVGRAMSAGVEASTKSGQGPSGAAARPEPLPPSIAEQARGLHRSRRASVLQRARTNPRRLRVAAPLQASAQTPPAYGRCASMTCATPTAHCSPPPAWTS